MSVPKVPVVPSVDLGNTKTKSTNKQDSPKKRWVFTLNNYEENDMNIIIGKCEKNSSKYSIGREVGESGTKHLQGYIELQVKKRFSFMKELLGARAHIEGCKGSRQDNLEYTQKDKDFEQNFEEKIYVQPLNKDFLNIKKLMDDYDFPKGDRKINVVIDPIGCKGKTEFCRWACIEYDDIIVTGGKAADMKNQIVEFKKKMSKCPKYLLIDCPRSGKLDYQGLEEVKNMLFYSGKFEGGMIVGNKPFVCIFMNEEPKFHKLSEDRWNAIYI